MTDGTGLSAPQRRAVAKARLAEISAELDMLVREVAFYETGERVKLSHPAEADIEVEIVRQVGNDGLMYEVLTTDGMVVEMEARYFV